MASAARRAAGSIYVLAGCNGAGKSSVGGAALHQAGVEFFNPDIAAQRIAVATGGTRPTQAALNAAAWNQGRRLLEMAIARGQDFAFETTLAGATMPRLLAEAAAKGMAIHVWFVGLDTVDLHIDRVRRRVAKGGHDIPVARIRERYLSAPANLIHLLPGLAELLLFDNSGEGDPAAGVAPSPRLLLHARHGRVVAPANLLRLMAATPGWAKAIVAAALKLHAQRG